MAAGAIVEHNVNVDFRPCGTSAHRPDCVAADEAAAGLVLPEPVLVPAGVEDAIRATRQLQRMPGVGQEHLDAEVQGGAGHSEYPQRRTGKGDAAEVRTQVPHFRHHCLEHPYRVLGNPC